MQKKLSLKKVPWHEQALYDSFKNKFETHVQLGNKPYHIIDDEEDIGLRALQRKAIALAALTGITGVLLLYLPGLFFPDSYLSQNTHLLKMNLLEIQPYFFVYGIVLAFFEIMVLTFLNLWVVRRIAEICDFPHRQDVNRDKHIRVLFEVSLEKQDKEMPRFNLNPLEGLSPWKLFLYNTLFVLKATLSNIIVKLILSRVLGRFILRALIDLVGIPIFAFWNGLATSRVIKEAKTRIMAPQLIHDLCKIMHQEFKDDEVFKEHLYDVLQWIAVTKRSFHHNHLLLANHLQETFQFEYKDKKPKSFDEVLAILKTLPAKSCEGLSKIFIFGVLLDGKVNSSEVSLLKQLSQELKIDFNPKQIWALSEDFVKGRGLEAFFTQKIISAS
jgi:hypothetical protein